MKTISTFLCRIVLYVPVMALVMSFVTFLFASPFRLFSPPSSPLADANTALIGGAIAGALIGIYAALRGDKFG